MTFGRQQSVMVLIGMVGVGIALCFAVSARNGLSNPTLESAVNIAFGFGLFFLFVALGRAVHRHMWLNYFVKRFDMQTMLDGPLDGFWQRWLNIDQKGNDRDA